MAEAVRLAPTSAVTRANLAMQRMNGDDFDAALADANQAIQMAPSGYDYYVRGLVWEAKGDATHALADYNQALQGQQPFPPAGLMACRVEGEAGADFDKAMADCSRYTMGPAPEPVALYGRALARFQHGDFAGAIADADATLHRLPTLAGAKYVRGLAKKRLGQAADGEADMAAAIAASSADVGSARRLAHQTVNRPQGRASVTMTP